MQPPQDLGSLTRKELDELASRRGVVTSRSMTKSDLVKALGKSEKKATSPPLKRAAAKSPTAVQKTEPAKAANGSEKTKSKRRRAAKPAEAPEDAGTLALAPTRDLSGPADADFTAQAATEPLIITVCEPHWLRASWQVSREWVRRVMHRLGMEWHRARPVLRVLDVTSDDEQGSTEKWIQDLDIRTDVSTWYVYVSSLTSAYRVQIGYSTPQGAFYGLARSNIVHIPKWSHSPRATPVTSTPSERPARVTARKSGRETSAPRLASSEPRGWWGSSAELLSPVAVELTVRGHAHPACRLTVQHEIVRLGEDGSYELHMELPEGRQVISLVAASPTGHEQRTVILGVERNTKELEPQYLDEGDVQMLGE